MPRAKAKAKAKAKTKLQEERGSRRDQAVQRMMGMPLGKLCEQADAVVLVFGKGVLFMRPGPEAQKVELPPHEYEVALDHTSGKPRVKGVTVKVSANHLEL